MFSWFCNMGMYFCVYLPMSPWLRTLGLFPRFHVYVPLASQLVCIRVSLCFCPLGFVMLMCICVSRCFSLLGFQSGCVFVCPLRFATWVRICVSVCFAPLALQPRCVCVCMRVHVCVTSLWPCILSVYRFVPMCPYPYVPLALQHGCASVCLCVNVPLVPQSGLGSRWYNSIFSVLVCILRLPFTRATVATMVSGGHVIFWNTTFLALPDLPGLLMHTWGCVADHTAQPYSHNFSCVSTFVG